ncbi:MAG TPA: zinc ribbon domain-containing protein [Clostridia bacterium]
MYCRYCGFQLDIGDKYCINCGARVQAQSFDGYNYNPPGFSSYSNNPSVNGAQKSNVSVVLAVLLIILALFSSYLATILSLIMVIYSYKSKKTNVLILSLCALILSIIMSSIFGFNIFGYPPFYWIRRLIRSLFY